MISIDDQAELDALSADTEDWLRDPGRVAQQLVQARGAIAASDAQTYCEMAMAFEGHDVRPHGMHVLIHDLLHYSKSSHQSPVLVLPPEHGKSSQVAKFIVHSIGCDTRLRVAMVSASEKTARRNLIHARKTLVSPLTQALWPAIRPDIKRSASGGGWSQEHLYLEGNTDPSVMSYSLLADCQGMRFDLIWLDDVITRECRFYEAKRIDAHSAIHDVWLNRLTDDGLAILTNNCWHREDSIHRATQSPAFATLWLGYEGTERIYWRVHHPPTGWPHATHGTLPLWHEVWPRTRLERKRAADPPAFKRLFEQRATVADDSRLPTPDTWATYQPHELPIPDSGARPLAYLDPAGGRWVERGDYAALMLGIVARDRALYVLDVWLRRTPPERQIEAIWRVHARLIEAGWPGGLHQAWIEVLPKDEEWLRLAVEQVRARMRLEAPATAWPAIAFDWPDTTASKESRIERLHGPLGSGQIRFPAGFRELARDDGMRGASWATLIAQAEDFGQKGTLHDDGPDALEGLCRKAILIGPGLAAEGSQWVGPREQARDLAARQRELARGRVPRDIRTGLPQPRGPTRFV